MIPALRFATAAMGTRFELLVLEGLEGAVDLQACGEAAIEEIEEWHRRLNRFAADSLLSHINRTAAHERVRLDRQMFELLSDAMAVSEASGGAFDITATPGAPATAHGRRALGPAVSLRKDDWTIGFDDPEVSLDLGGIAKGHALDCAGALLRAHGVVSALLHGGTSSVLAVGMPPGSAGWPIALGHRPNPDVIALRDEALSVSDSQGQVDIGTEAHIVDPGTGHGVVGTGSIAVRGPSARLADAWSTALVVLGHVPETFQAGYEVYRPADTLPRTTWLR